MSYYPLIIMFTVAIPTIAEVATPIIADVPTSKGMMNDVLRLVSHFYKYNVLLFSYSLKQYYHRLLLGCHGELLVIVDMVTMDTTELDYEQNDWPEMRLLKDRELTMRYFNNCVSIHP